MRVYLDVDQMTPVEIQKAGLVVLVQELGAVGFVRFIQQYELGKGNYTKDRHQWLDHLSNDDVLRLIEEEQNKLDT